MDPLSRTTTSPLSSGVIEMRRLAALHVAPSRTSMPTLDLVLSVGAPVSALGRPDAVRIERAESRWPEIAVPALTWVLGLALGGLLLTLAPVPRAALTAPSSAAVEVPAAPVVATDPTPVAEPTMVEPTSEEPAPAIVEPAVLEPALRARRPRAATTAAETPVATPATASAPERSSLDALLERATSAETSSPTSAAPSPTLRRAPSRDEVRAAMVAVEPAVTTCAGGEHGRIVTTVTVDGETGRVRSALVNGDFAGTSSGSCMARALRTIELEPFAQDSFTVQYPFSI